MSDSLDTMRKLHINDISKSAETRYLNPDNITLPQGYRAEVFVTGLDVPSSMTFTEDGTLLIAESGIFSGKPRVLSLKDNNFQVITDKIPTPITGITYDRNNIYVAHKGFITLVRLDGTMQQVLSGLPSSGDYGNSNVAFGPDGKMYFGQGTITNSGVVGLDNAWISTSPFLCDQAGSYILLNGQNYPAQNIMSMESEVAYTGAFSPFGVRNEAYEVRKGYVKASGSILRVNPDGTELELVSWGLRFPNHVRFDRSNRLFVANIGYENRGSRPIANAPDEFQLVNSNYWYGWPDYAGGEPVTNIRFQPEGGKPVEFLLTNHPKVPPRPYAAFPQHSNIMGFDFSYNGFGPYGDAYIAEFGSAGLTIEGEVTPYAGFGHRISKINMGSGVISTFAINKSGFSASLTREGGFSRPVEVVFGPDRAMYVLDVGMTVIDNANIYYSNTGVIWKIINTLL